jgi:hypothetical protein
VKMSPSKLVVRLLNSMYPGSSPVASFPVGLSQPFTSSATVVMAAVACFKVH